MRCCAFKIDILKAYDTVDWSFLRNILIQFGFHQKIVCWVMGCVTTASLSININGNLALGLHQADPVSPYLFTLVMEVFNACD